MRKIQKILLGVFLGGVFLGGVGTGVAFLEFSSISYGGERKIAQENMVTEDLDFVFDKDAGVVILTPVWYDGINAYLNPETDESVPEGVIRYRVTYNTKGVTPYLRFHEYEEPEAFGEMDDEMDADMADEGMMDDQMAEDSVDGVTIDESETAEETDMADESASGEEKKTPSVKIQGSLFMEKRYKDEIGIWMENKDQILSDLKQGKIASYSMDYITDIKVLVNPATKPYVKQERE